MAYSTVDDLLLGDVPLSGTFNREKYINDAADEIDSHVGSIYATPIDMTDAGPVVRHSRLLVKRVSNFLASGRILMALNGSDTSLHAYGANLVREALDALRLIMSGSVVIEGAIRNDGDTGAPGPAVFNADSASAVDAFYNRVMRPELDLVGGVMPYRDWAPGSDPRGAGVPYGG